MTSPSSLENPITGKDWTKEVGSINYTKEQIRADFYKKRAELKLEVPDVKAVLDDPKKANFKTLDDLEKGPAFAPVEVKSGDSLFKILDAYFKAQGSDKTQKETYLSLHYLGTQKEVSLKNINVDYLLVGETVKIEKGRLTIAGKNGTERIKDALLRPEVAVVMPPPAAPLVAPPADATPPIPEPAPPAAPVPEPPPPAPPAVPVDPARPMVPPDRPLPPAEPVDPARPMVPPDRPLPPAEPVDPTRPMVPPALPASEVAPA